MVGNVGFWRVCCGINPGIAFLEKRKREICPDSMVFEEVEKKSDNTGVASGTYDIQNMDTVIGRKWFSGGRRIALSGKGTRFCN